MIEDMLDLKTEAENYTDQKLDLEKSIDQVFTDVQKQGVKVNSRTKKEVKKIIKEKSKRYDHKVLYMTDCMRYDMEYDSQIEEQGYLMNSGIILAAKAGKDHQEEDKEVIIPVKLIVGVTGALAGMFILLIPLPIPGKVNVGSFLVGTGVTYCADALMECAEQNRKKEPHKP